MVYGLALTNDAEDLFDFCVEQLGTSIADYPADFEEARTRTDAVLRQLLEFILMASVTCHNVN